MVQDSRGTGFLHTPNFSLTPPLNLILTPKPFVIPPQAYDSTLSVRDLAVEQLAEANGRASELELCLSASEGRVSELDRLLSVARSQVSELSGQASELSQSEQRLLQALERQTDEMRAVRDTLGLLSSSPRLSNSPSAVLPPPRESEGGGDAGKGEGGEAFVGGLALRPSRTPSLHAWTPTSEGEEVEDVPSSPPGGTIVASSSPPTLEAVVVGGHPPQGQMAVATPFVIPGSSSETLMLEVGLLVHSIPGSYDLI